MLTAVGWYVDFGRLAAVQVGGWVREGGGLRPVPSVRRRRLLRIVSPQGLRAPRKDLRRQMVLRPPPRVRN